VAAAFDEVDEKPHGLAAHAALVLADVGEKVAAPVARRAGRRVETEYRKILGHAFSRRLDDALRGLSQRIFKGKAGAYLRMVGQQTGDLAPIPFVGALLGRTGQSRRQIGQKERV